MDKLAIKQSFRDQAPSSVFDAVTSLPSLPSTSNRMPGCLTSSHDSACGSWYLAVGWPGVSWLPKLMTTMGASFASFQYFFTLNIGTHLRFTYLHAHTYDEAKTLGKIILRCLCQKRNLLSKPYFIYLSVLICHHYLYICIHTCIWTHRYVHACTHTQK